jgi:GT2 family glycosyltransferase
VSARGRHKRRGGSDDHGSAAASADEHLMMTYSFLLVNFNMAGLLQRCLASIERECAGSAYETLVAENSTDPRFAVSEEMAARHPHLRLIRLEENRGFIDALNRLVPLAAGEFVVIMHPDVELEPGCLAALGAFLEAHPRAGVVGPDLVDPDGTPDVIRLRFPSVRGELRRVGNVLAHILLRRRPFRAEPRWDRRGDVRADMVMSVMMMFRRQALVDAGPVCPRLWTYYGNDWLCARLGQDGWTCHYVVGARAIHYERNADRRLYSDADCSSYKRSPVPVSDRMEADRLTFLRQFYSRPRLLAFRALLTVEYMVHILAQFKPGRPQRAQSIRKFGATIRAAWA